MFSVLFMILSESFDFICDSFLYGYNYKLYVFTRFPIFSLVNFMHLFLYKTGVSTTFSINTRHLKPKFFSLAECHINNVYG